MPSRPTVPTPLLALAGASAAGVAVVYLLAVRTGPGQRLDDSASGDLRREAAPAVYDATAEILDTISVSSLALLGLAIMAIALVRGRPLQAAAAGALVLGANITTQALKRELPRPDLLGEGAAGGSYPSGHVTVAVSLAMALVLVVPAAARWPAALVGVAYATGVGVAVIALDWHRPSDVVGAQLVAVGWAALAAAAVAWRDARRRGPAPARGSTRARRAGAVAAALLGAAFVAVVAATAAPRLDPLRVVEDRSVFAAAAVVTSLAGIALAGLATALMQRRRGPR